MEVPIVLPTILTQSVCPLFAHELFLMWAENVDACGHKKEREKQFHALYRFKTYCAMYYCLVLLKLLLSDLCILVQ